MDDESNENKSSNTQTIIIIILVIIGIILFIFFIVEFVTIPPPTLAPFTDGAVIRIKSLSNNQYLRPISCADLPGPCNIPGLCPGAARSFIAADGIRDDQNTKWVLCQYKFPPPPGATGVVEAAYLVYNQSAIHDVNMFYDRVDNIPYLITNNNSPVCMSVSPEQMNCTTRQFYFTFTLQEDALGPQGIFNQNGTYFIKTVNLRELVPDSTCPDTPFYWYNGLTTTCGINAIEMVSGVAESPDRTTLEEIINFGFFIEVVN